MDPDRKGFVEKIQKRIKKGGHFGVLSIYVRGYRYANMLYGYQAGEDLLRSLSEVLGRIGEWGVIETNCFGVIVEVKEINNFDVEVLERLKEPVAFGPTLFSVGLVIGMACHPAHATEAEELLRKADLALTSLWHRHELGFQVYNQEFDRILKRQGELALDMDAALDRGEFEVYFQPQYRTSTGKIAGAEALLRWKRQDRFIAPGRFIPLAEMTGRIAKLGEWMLRRTCRSVAAWPGIEEQRWRIGVNVSVPQFYHASFVPLVEELLERYGLSPSSLELEITESVALESFDGTLSKLKDLRAKGIGLAMDDFGTGFSSLSYLYRLPFTKLKIAQSFIRGIPAVPEKMILTETAVDLGRKLGMEVIAEGVEQEIQHKTLLQMGCDLVQGNFCSPAVPERKMSRFLENYLKECTFSEREPG
ncbi:MAG: putative bifunctional diguanylate cyclase/phosphodiesterase [Desulfovibrionales bacterium]